MLHIHKTIEIVWIPRQYQIHMISIACKDNTTIDGIKIFVYGNFWFSKKLEISFYLKPHI